MAPAERAVVLLPVNDGSWCSTRKIPGGENLSSDFEIKPTLFGCFGNPVTVVFPSSTNATDSAFSSDFRGINAGPESTEVRD